MKAPRNKCPVAKAPLIEVKQVSITTTENRTLFHDLNLCLSQEHVALIGRNGVGKSTLLRILSGKTTPDKGKVTLRTEPYFVDQSLDPGPESADVKAVLRWFKHTPLSQLVLAGELAAAGLRPQEQLSLKNALCHGELRKLKLLIGKMTRPEVMLLDEPSQDLDECGISWLRGWLADWQGGLLVASHDPQLLEDFENFFIVAESGCRCFTGTFSALENELEQERSASQLRYLRNLNRLVEQEEHTFHVARRRQRKKQYGRISELGRATPRKRLNQKRDYAQVKHGRMKKMREARLDAVREWAKSTRRALKVNLPLVVQMPKLSAECECDLIALKNVSAIAGGRCLFQHLDLCLRRERLGVIGANGVGKTTLLKIMLGREPPSSGSVEIDDIRVGGIAQGGTDWMLDETLLSYLWSNCPDHSPAALAELLASHKFPIALAQRPMHSLSPGERVRAALICLFQRSPAIELLVLDEPTYSLDLVGQRALTHVLRAWPGGLVIASHNRTFLSAIGIEKYLTPEAD